jgi:hypothetical protein
VLLIGIDEAGYGPKIGPLCHGYCAFRCPEQNEQAGQKDSAPPDLWALLHPSAMKFPAFEGSIPVDDSKRIHTADRSLKALTHGVRSFLDCLPPESKPAILDDLYSALLSIIDRSRLEEDAWAAAKSETTEAPEPEKPVSKRSGKKNKLPEPPPENIPPLKDALANAEVSILSIGARAMSAKHYNSALKSGNKADVSWTVIVEQLESLLRLAQPGESVYISIDRQGGRKFYAGRMGNLFAGSMPWVESETPHQSVYKIEHDGRTIRVAFLVNADGLHFPVALGSMAAKLTRELCMRRLNAYFKSHEPTLKPTAGYYGDASRFLRETKALRKKLGIDNEHLIRMK